MPLAHGKCPFPRSYWPRRGYRAKLGDHAGEAGLPQAQGPVHSLPVRDNGLRRVYPGDEPVLSFGLVYYTARCKVMTRSVSNSHFDQLPYHI